MMMDYDRTQSLSDHKRVRKNKKIDEKTESLGSFEQPLKEAKKTREKLEQKRVYSTKRYRLLKQKKHFIQKVCCKTFWTALSNILS